MLVVRADMIAIECVVRGYLSGSGWKEYKASGAVCGIKLARRTARVGQAAGADLHAGDQGDQRSRREHLVRPHGKLAGRELSEQLRDLSIKIYQTAADYAETRGIIIADTKFEFGRTAQRAGAGR